MTAVGRRALVPSGAPSCQTEPAAALRPAEGCSLRGSRPGRDALAQSDRMWMLVSLGGKKHLRMLEEGLGIRRPQRVQETSCSGGCCVPQRRVLCWLHTGSEIAAPSRVPIKAQRHFSMWGLAPASRLGEQSLGPRLYPGEHGSRQQEPALHHPPCQARPLPPAAGLCCHHLLLCLLLTSWFNSKALRMVKTIIQNFF